MDPTNDFEIEEEVDYELDDDFLNQGFEEEDAQRALEQQAAEDAAKEAAKKQAEESKAAQQPSTASDGNAYKESKASDNTSKTGPKKRVPIPVPTFVKTANPLDKEEVKPGSNAPARLNQALDGGQQRGRGGRGGRGSHTGGRGGRGGNNDASQSQQGGRFGGRGFHVNQGNQQFQQFNSQFPNNNNNVANHGQHQNMHRQAGHTGGLPFPMGQGMNDWRNLQFGAQDRTAFMPQMFRNNDLGMNMRMSGAMSMMGSGASGGLPMPPGMSLQTAQRLHSADDKNTFSGLDVWSPEDSSGKESRRAQNSGSRTSDPAKHLPPARLLTGHDKSFFAHGMDAPSTRNAPRKRIADRLSAAPRLAGDLEEDAEPPRKRSPPSSHRMRHETVARMGPPIPPPMPPAETPEELALKAEKAAKAKAIQEKIEAQKLENALIRKAEKLKKEAAIAALQKQIDALEAASKKSSASGIKPAPAVAKPSEPSPKRKAEREVEESEESPKKKHQSSSNDSEEESIDLPKPVPKKRTTLRSEEAEWKKPPKWSDSKAVGKGDLREFLSEQRAKRKGGKESGSSSRRRS